MEKVRARLSYYFGQSGTLHLISIRKLALTPQSIKILLAMSPVEGKGAHDAIARKAKADTLITSGASSLFIRK